MNVPAQAHRSGPVVCNLTYSETLLTWGLLDRWIPSETMGASGDSEGFPALTDM